MLTDDSRSVLGSRPLHALMEAVAPIVGREASDLVAAFFDQPRHWPTLNGDASISDGEWDAVIAAAGKRAAGAPLQYAVGKANFRNLTLAVDERVLIPRPETELLVDLVLERVSSGIAVDVGTGSGAIAIALATEGMFDHVIATDISQDALEVAGANAVRVGARVEFVHSDLLAGAGREPGTERPSSVEIPTAAEHSVVVSNPPYIAFDEARQLPPSVRDWEPPVALYSPHDGIMTIRRLVPQAAASLREGGLLALEVDSRRASLAADLVARDDRFADVSVHLDLTGRERFVLAFRRRRSRND